MMRRNLRRAVLIAHLWVGLSFGLLLSVMGLSGSALVFGHEIDAQLNPQLLHIEPQHKRVSWQTILDGVRRTAPDAVVQHIFVAREPNQTHQVLLKAKDARRSLFVNPYSGQIVGARQAKEGVIGWLTDLHTHLLSGENGEKVVGIGGVMLLILGVSGLILWWPGLPKWRRGFTVHRNAGWKGLNYDGHRVGGALISGLLAVTALTGIALVWSSVAADVLHRVTGEKPLPKVKSSRSKTMLPLGILVARANTAMPDGQMTRISFPNKSGAPLIIRKKLPGELHPNGMNAISLDASTGRVLQVARSDQATRATRLMNLRYPLHIGVVGGNLTRAFYVLLGLAPGALFVSGFLMWWNKLRAKRARRVSPQKTTDVRATANV